MSFLNSALVPLGFAFNSNIDWGDQPAVDAIRDAADGLSFHVSAAVVIAATC
jgi:hypothetical protein